MNIYYSVLWLQHEIDQEFKLNDFIIYHVIRRGFNTFFNLSDGPIVPSRPPNRVTCTFIQPVH